MLSNIYEKKIMIKCATMNHCEEDHVVDLHSNIHGEDNIVQINKATMRMVTSRVGGDQQ